MEKLEVLPSFLPSFLPSLILKIYMYVYVCSVHGYTWMHMDAHGGIVDVCG
jgi:hypothetical protein